MLVIGMIIGFVLGSWLSFNFVLDVGIDKIHQVMYNISTDLWKQTSNMLEKYKNEVIQNVSNLIKEKKQQIKAEIKQQILEYINKKIDSLF